jgi:hypothetical protein
MVIIYLIFMIWSHLDECGDVYTRLKIHNGRFSEATIREEGSFFVRHSQIFGGRFRLEWENVCVSTFILMRWINVNEYLKPDFDLRQWSAVVVSV